MKFDTTIDRIAELDRLFIAATRIEKAFKREVENIDLGDILALLAMMENIYGLKELIRTEQLFNDTITEAFAVGDETSATRQKFIALFGRNAATFIKDILIARLGMCLSMARNERYDESLAKYQDDFKRTLTAMRDTYRDIYKL